MNVNSKAVRGLALAPILVLLQACGGAASHMSGYSDDPWASIAVVQNPDINGGRIAPEAIALIERYGESCNAQIDAQSPSRASNAAQGAVNYGVPGAAGTALGATLGLDVANPGGYATYGGVAGAANGAVSGMYAGSYARNAAEGSCVQAFVGDVRPGNPVLRGTHVVTMFAGSRGPAREEAPAPAR